VAAQVGPTTAGAGRGLAALLATLLPFLAPSFAPAQSTPFPHRRHLDDNFRNDPGNANCTKRCHTFQDPGMEAYRATYKGCAACHQPLTADRMGARIEGSDAKPDRPPDQAGFLHQSAAHAALSCLECHAVLENGPTGLDFAIPKDLALCRRCHSEHGDKNPKNQSLGNLLTKAGPNACVTCHLTRTRDAARQRNDRQFLHRDHLSDGDQSTAGWTQGACSLCHQKVAAAPPIRPDNYAALFLGPGQAGASCGKCHRDHPLQLDASGKLDVDASVAGLAWEKRARTGVITTFSHAKHTAVERLKQCTTCHPPSPSGEPQTDATYVTCVACHTDRAVENHPNGVCMRCHQNALPATEAAAAIATQTVKREVAAGFVLKSHAHPEITSGGAPLEGEKCSECHLGRPAALLRPRARPFDHASHLAGAPTSADCLNCHKNVIATVDNGFVHRYDDPPPGQAMSCEQCHRGSDFATPREVKERPVPKFSHRPHLASKKRKLECADCHRSDPTRASSLGVPTVDSCKECHGHVDPKKVELTGSKSTGQQGGRCDFCHAPDPQHEKDEFKFEVVRSSGRLEPGHQWHDRNGGCEACHALGKLGPVVARLDALVVRSPHNVDAPYQALRKEWFNDPKSDCIGRCHVAGPVKVDIERRRQNVRVGR
jgi:hypothetical protein